MDATRRREPRGTGSAERFRLDDVLEGEARRRLTALAEVRVERVGQVAAREDRPRDARGRELVEQVGEQRPIDERQHRFRRPQRERSQARARASDEDDRVHQSALGRPTPS